MYFTIIDFVFLVSKLHVAFRGKAAVEARKQLRGQYHGGNAAKATMMVWGRMA